MSFKIFISYSTLDLSHVEQLRDQLKDSPIEIFVAENSVAPSEDLANKISTAITQCDLFVLIWSQNAKESDWVSQEIGRATALKKTVLPLVLTKSLKLPGFISGLKYLSVHSNPDQSLKDAREIILNEYEKKQSAVRLQSQQKDKDNMALMGIGAFLLWAFTRK